MWLIRHFAHRSRGSDWRAYFLIACVAILALLLAGASWSAHRSASEREAAEAWRTHTVEVLLETDRLRTAALQQIRGERGYLLTDDRRFLDPYLRGRRDAAEARDGLAKLVSDNPAQIARLRKLDSEIVRLETVFETMIEQQADGRNAEAVRYLRRGNDRVAMETILATLADIETVERGLLAERTALADRRARENELYQYGLTLVGAMLLVLAGLATVYVRRAVDAEAEARRELQRSAATDALTGRANRRSFMESLDRAIARADESSQLCVAIFDIDHFKRVNDRFGHPAGDAVIREVTNRGAASLRQRDVIARIGGEEFAVILPKADVTGAQIVCERLRVAIDGKPVRYGDAIIPFTVSVGIAEYAPGDDLDHILARADCALYEAKTGGRNQVRIAA